MHRVKRCGLLLPVPMFRGLCPRVSLCVCICWTQPWAVRKRINRSRCHLGYGLGNAQGTMYYVWAQIPSWKEAIWRKRLVRCGLSSKFFDQFFWIESKTPIRSSTLTSFCSFCRIHQNPMCVNSVVLIRFTIVFVILLLFCVLLLGFWRITLYHMIE